MADSVLHPSGGLSNSVKENVAHASFFIASHSSLRAFRGRCANDNAMVWYCTVRDPIRLASAPSVRYREAVHDEQFCELLLPFGSNQATLKTSPAFLRAHMPVFRGARFSHV